MKLPDSPAALSLTNPYPDLEESWGDEDREWGWTLGPLDVIPDLRPAIELAERVHPASGPARHRPRNQQPRSDRPLFRNCQRCGYEFDGLTTQEFCGYRTACDRRLRKPGYRVPKGRTQDMTIRNATIAAHPELGPQPGA